MGFAEDNAWVKQHADLYRRDPVSAHDWQSVDGSGVLPTLLLTTIGRRTGNRVDTPLVYGKTGDSFIVVGSKNGAPDHPHWYKNLAVNTNAEIQVGAKHHYVSARTAAGEERAELMAVMVSLSPYYRVMEQAAAPDREIPLVVLSPRP